MGFNINETITTNLHYKEIALIATTIGLYIEQYKNTADKETLLKMKRLVNRLGNEMFDYKQDKD